MGVFFIGNNKFWGENPREKKILLEKVIHQANAHLHAGEPVENFGYLSDLNVSPSLSVPLVMLEMLKQVQLDAQM